jgi:DNA-binding transcriptional LysR family regulator
MTLAQLTSFLEVARRLSFRRAAERLHLAQPSVSAHIRELERELGAPLFERAARRVRLTYAGEVLLAHAERVLTEVDEARAAVSALGGEALGGLAIGTTSSLVGTLLPPVVRRLQLDAPRVTVRLGVGTSDEIVAGLRRGDYDLGLAYLTHAEPALRVIPVLEDEFILIVSPEHPLAVRPAIQARELHGLPLIALGAETAGRAIIDRALGDLGVRPEILMELFSSDAIKAMVGVGVAPAIVSRLAVAAELETGYIRMVPISDLRLRHSVVGLTRARGTPGAPLRAALDALRAVYPSAEREAEAGG